MVFATLVIVIEFDFQSEHIFNARTVYRYFVKESVCTHSYTHFVIRTAYCIPQNILLSLYLNRNAHRQMRFLLFSTATQLFSNYKIRTETV